MKPMGVSVPTALLTAAMVVPLAACAPGTPDQDSWRVDALRAVGDVSSAVSTMQVALQHHDRIFAPYLRTVAVQAEDNAGTASQKLSGRQPPDPYRKRYHTVTTALDDADSLLSDARIAVVRHNSAAYADLITQLSKTSDQLSSIEDQIRALPDDRSRP